MMRASHLEPGELAPASGTYQEHNVFGSPTGHQVTLDEGKPLPRAPRGFTWLPVARSED